MDEKWWIGLCLLAAYAALIVLFLAWQRRRSTPGDLSLGCGSCGYPVRGLPSSICPECGADIDKVGLRRPTWWNRRTPATRRGLCSLAWTIGIAWLAMLGYPLFDAYLLPGTITIMDGWGAEISGQPYYILMERAWKIRTIGHGRGYIPSSNDPLAEVGVALYPRGMVGTVLARYGYDVERAAQIWSHRPPLHGPTFVADFRNQEWACFPAPEPEAEPPSTLSGRQVRPLRGTGNWREAMQHWLVHASEDAQEKTLGPQLASLLDQLLASPYRSPPAVLPDVSPHGTTSGRHWDPDESYRPYYPAAAGLLWLAGLLLIIRPRRRARAPH